MVSLLVAIIPHTLRNHTDLQVENAKRDPGHMFIAG
jgi:hypothetical protein